MNDPHESLSDELLDDLLAPLRNVTIPGEVRVANRELVHRALVCRAQPPWWRRTVAVPVPIAVAATVMFAITVAALLRPSWAPQRVEREAPRPIQNQFVEIRPASISDTDKVAGPAWSVRRQYLQSLESLARVRNSVNPDAKEKRDDS